MQLLKVNNFKPSPSRYVEIKDWISTRIDRGEYRKGELLPTETELATTHKVSRITIRRALQALEKENRAIHLPQKGFMVKSSGGPVEERAEEVGLGQTGFVCLDISQAGFQNPFFLDILEGVYKVVRENKLSSPILYDQTAVNNMADFLKQIRQDRISGLVFSGGIEYSKLVAICKEVPHVVLANSDWKIEGVPRVVVPQAQGAYELVQHLITLGHKRIGFISRVMDIPYLWPDEEKHLNLGGFSFFIDGYRKALHEAGLEIDDQLIQNVAASDPKWDNAYWAGRRLMQLKNPPTAIFCHNDFAAARVLEAMKELGIRVPEDVAVVGFDDSDIASYVTPKLTTVAVPRKLVGKIAGSLLIKKMRGEPVPEEDVVVSLNLMIRESCGGGKVRNISQ